MWVFFVDMYEDDDGDEITQDLWQEACWIVISSYFDEKVQYYYFLLFFKHT